MRFSIFSKQIGIDLGTSNTLVCVKGGGIIVNESSVVAIDERGHVLAVGKEAKDMIGKTPGRITAIRPLRKGVIADFEITQKMIKYFIRKAIPRSSSFTGAKIVIGVPSQITEVERRAVYDAAIQAGAKEAYLIEEPMAAAIGSGLPVTEAMGSMIVDIGGGTTEIAVISLGGIVTARSIRTAGDELDQAIINYIKKNHNVIIGERTAEKIKIELGCAILPVKQTEHEIIGRHLVSGLPNRVKLRSADVHDAIKDTVGIIVEGIKSTLEKTPPELASDIFHSGIVLTGGGALLRDLDKLIANETNMPVRIAESPLDCVAIGTATVVESFDSLKVVFSAGKGR